MESARLMRLAIEVLNERHEQQRKQADANAWYAGAAARTERAVNG